MSDMGQTVRVVLMVTAIAGLIAVNSASGRSDPCPHGCRCSTRGGNTNRHRWHRLLAAYRARRLVYGDGRAGQTITFQRPRSAESRAQRGREMTCLGLSIMPDRIPTGRNWVFFSSTIFMYFRVPARAILCQFIFEFECHFMLCPDAVLSSLWMVSWNRRKIWKRRPEVTDIK